MSPNEKKRENNKNLKEMECFKRSLSYFDFNGYKSTKLIFLVSPSTLELKQRCTKSRKLVGVCHVSKSLFRRVDFLPSHVLILLLDSIPSTKFGSFFCFLYIFKCNMLCQTNHQNTANHDAQRIRILFGDTLQIEYSISTLKCKLISEFVQYKIEKSFL